jgi:hypothetical protein
VFVKIGGATTVMVKEHAAVFVPYAAVQLTVLVPTGKREPDGGTPTIVDPGVPVGAG